MTRTTVFIHGAWVTADCWDRFVLFFEAKGSVAGRGLGAEDAPTA